MEREKRIVRTSIIGIITNIILVIFKVIVGIIVNSIAIILDGINNLTDALSSIVTIIGTKLANKKPDKKHPYGHGRIEHFATLIVAAIIISAGIMAAKESVEKIIHPAETNYTIGAIIIILATVLVKIFLGTYFKRVGKSVNSNTLVASGSDALMDSVLTTVTFIGAIINLLFGIGLEGILGLIISIFIIKAGIEMFKGDLDSLIGIRADSELTNKIKEKVNSYKDVQGVYDLALHSYGPTKTIGTLHIQVRNDMTAEEIHKLTRKMTFDIYNEFGIIVTIGIYAANDSGEHKEVVEEVLAIIEQSKYIKEMHGFFVDSDNNVYFDLIIDFECEDREKVRHDVIAKLKEKYPKYTYIVIIDDDITD